MRGEPDKVMIETEVSTTMGKVREQEEFQILNNDAKDIVMGLLVSKSNEWWRK